MYRQNKPSGIQKIFFTACLALLCFGSASAQVFVKSDPATGKKGLVETATNKIVIPLEYDEVKVEARVVVVKKDRLQGVFALNGRPVLPVEFQEVSVGTRTGSARGLYAASRNFRWGLVDSTGKILVPFNFADVRPVFPDLFVGIHGRNRDSVYFFNPQGKQVFAARGNRVLRGFDDNTVKIMGSFGAITFLDKTGKPVFPANISGGIWTDGKTIIAASINSEGMKSHYALLSWAGDTLLAANYGLIRALGRDRFIVETRSDQSGLVDEKGGFLIPLTPGSIRPILTVEGSALEVGMRPQSPPSVYDTNGKLLYKDCHAGPVAKRSGDWSDKSILPNNSDNFFLIKNTQSGKLGLCHFDGRLVLPMTFDRIDYGSHKHPLIVSHDQIYEAMDWSGQTALAGRFRRLGFTQNPRILTAMHEINDLLAFVDLDAPRSAQFEFASISQLNSKFFAAKKGGLYYLYSPSAQRINSEGFAEITSVLGEDDYSIAFSEKKADKLVAIGRRKGQAPSSPEWVGFGENGKAWDFAQQPPKVMRKAGIGESAFNTNKRAPEAPPSAKPADGKTQQPPQFPGGEAALAKFWTDNLKYPAHANAIGISGYVLVSFVVEKDGTLTDLSIVRDIGGGCGQEAERLIDMMPKWSPGLLGGNPIRMQYSLQVPFKP